MNEEEFKNYIDNNINSISSKISLEEINFLGNLVNAFNEVCEKYYKLQNNWNELKEYCLNEQIPEEYDEYNSYIEFSNSVYENILNKMQELEQRKDENNK